MSFHKIIIQEDNRAGCTFFLIFRTKFLDFIHGSSYFVGNPSDTDLRQLFKNHLGLRIEVTNTGLKNISTRHKFMVAQLNSLEEKIMQQINK